MIKAIITDVDGVIVGTKKDVNFPLPTEQVIRRLEAVRKSGIPIILCTGKPTYSTEGIIRKAQLDNPHITDAGAYIYNPLRDQVIKEHTINKDVVSGIIKTCLEHNIYLEVHTAKGYFVQRDQVYSLTAIRREVLQKEHTEVDTLLDNIQAAKIIKILAIIPDTTKKEALESLLTPFHDQTNMIWSTVPFMLPAIARVITANDVSKMHAAQEVMEFLGLSFDECLGVGDLPADWEFMKLCKYAAATGDIDEEFKANVMSKGEGNYFLAPSADEDGFLDVIDYFIK